MIAKHERESRSELNTRNRIPKLLSLDLRNLQLQRTRRSSSSRTRKCPGTPWRSAVDFFQVGELAEGTAVSERDVDDAVVGEGGEGVGGGDFLASAGCAGGDEDSGVFVVESTFGPEAAG